MSLMMGSTGAALVVGIETATEVTAVLFGKGCLFETANLSDFANAVSPSSFGVVTFETSALKSDAVRTFIDGITPKQIKKTTASQTVLITQSPQGWPTCKKLAVPVGLG
jgi:hypothetical protein